MFKVTKAKREKVNVKVALMGPSGSGKTYSALTLAEGMAKEIERETGRKGRILMGNTEGSRGKYYANFFDYDIADLSAPYTPESFVEFIEFAMAEKYDIVVLDSITHEWEGTGGCLDIHKKAGGRQTDWAVVTPRHNKFIDKLSTSEIHIIATLRTKDAYETEQNEKGKTVLSKVGTAPKQRDGIEYEFTCTFMLDRNTHMAMPQKDNTQIFEDTVGEILTNNHGAKLIKWANSGEEPQEKKEIKVSTAADRETEEDSELKNLIAEIDIVAKKAINEFGVEKELISEAIKKYHEVNGKPTANYKTIKSVETAQKVLTELNVLCEYAE